MLTKKNRKIKNRILCCVSVIFLLFLAGCGKEAEETEDEMVIVDNTEDVSVYTLVAVTKQDVSLTENVTCEYVQSMEQNVVLEEGGRLITKVCVHEGDHVSPGDVLLQLDNNNLEEKIENLSYKIKCNELQLEYLEKKEEFSLNETYFGYVYGSGLVTEDDLAAYEKSVDGVERDYRYQREDLEDSLEFDRLELAAIKKELEGSRVYATIEGMVYEIEKDLEGSVTKKDKVIMTVVDESDGYFVSDDEKIFSQITPGGIYSMHISYGIAQGDYEMNPIRLDEWGEKQYFEVLSGPEGGILSVGEFGTMSVPIEVRENVLALPNGCIHEAGDEKYVYVLDDAGMKTVVFVKIGLVGNDYTEITEGLSEGDMVVRK